MEPIGANRKSYSIAISAGLVYGLGLRLLFAKQPGNHSFDRFLPSTLWVMTAGFLVLVPFVVGWIIASSSQRDDRYHWTIWLFSPWLAILLSDFVLFLTNIEGLICIVFAIPITLIFASIGGITGGLITRSRILNRRATTLCLAVLPLLLSAIELQLQPPTKISTVQTSILIHAPSSVVWNNIERVPAIRPSEITPNWTHRIGFPSPIEATLDHEGIGGVRHASFQGGLLFIETITQWQPQQRIAFTIAADTAHIPATTLDEHVTIGGQYFDVLNGEYQLEPLSNGNILLHLSSQERLSTDFNAYASLWTDAVMRNLQQSILEVIKHRCEAESTTTSATLKP
jgi:hypothetical protein